jgi:uncharacterized membrane protein YqjE
MTLSTQIRELVDAVSDVLAQHLRLARLELKDDARFLGLRVGLLAALAPCIVVGYGFLCMALALLLQRFMVVELAFLVVGLVNVIAGASGIWAVLKQVSQKKMLSITSSELESSSALILNRNENHT